MPQYKKVFDVGTYAGVSGYTRVGIPTLRTPGSGGKQVAKSLRFRSSNSAYLSRTPGTTGDRQKFTYSAWIKRGTSATSVSLFSAYNNSGTTDSDWFNVTFLSGASPVDSININGWNTNYIRTLAIFSDPSAWYHIVVAVDTTSATSTITGTSTDRIRLYVNGIQIKTFNIANAPTQSLNTPINSTSYQHRIGSLNWSSAAQYFDGYMSEVYLIDGTALDPTSFGEYNSDNIWVPKAYSGSYGTNGFYLDFNDTSSVAALGYDAAGSNDWTVNGISLTAGTTYDSMIDTPTDWDNSGVVTGNYAVLNPLDTGGTAPSAANLQLTAGAAERGVRSTFAIPTSGLWYGEATVGTNQSGATDIGFGFAASTVSLTTNPSGLANVWGLYGTATTYITRNGTGTLAGAGAALTSGEILQFAIDLTNNKGWIGRGNVWFNGTTGTNGDPATGANPTFTFSSPPTLFPWVHGYSSTIDINFGQRTFVHTPPTGFKALNTKNITRPTDANMWFYGDTPDLMWIKNRTATTADHSLTDTVRGVGLGLSSSSTAVEQGAQDVAEMNKFGMTLIGASSRTTAASNSFVYWGWKGGGAPTIDNVAGAGNVPTAGSVKINGENSSATLAGSIAATRLSANTSAGFSVVTFTSPASGSASIAHGLGVTPAMFVIKSRSPNTSTWALWHTSLASATDSYLNLNNTNAVATSAGIWGSGPTSSVFGIGSGSYVASNTYVAYCFAPVAGYSAFGSYTGNGSTDGPFVYTGFRPRFIMIKRYDTGSVENWEIWDSARPGYNATALQLFANTTGNESDGTARPCIIDFLSNGFKLRGSNSEMNTLSSTYIYAAFAEHPFKIARAR